MASSIGITACLKQYAYKLVIRAEMDVLRDSKDPEPQSNINDLWVFHGETRYIEQGDTYDWMQMAIRCGRVIAALKTNTSTLKGSKFLQSAPRIIYCANNVPKDDITRAISDSSKSLHDYPGNKFTILKSKNDSIKSQFLSMKKLHLKNSAIGIVTSAHLCSRITRYLDESRPLYPFGSGMTIYLFLTNRDFALPKTFNTLREKEIVTLSQEIAKGGLPRLPNSKVITREKNKCEYFAESAYALFKTIYTYATKKIAYYTYKSASKTKTT